jgi:hypothetical protein
MVSWGGSVDPGMAQVAIDHPEWLIMDKNGNYPRDCRDMYQFCPALPEVQEYMKETVLTLDIPHLFIDATDSIENIHQSILTYLKV